MKQCFTHRMPSHVTLLSDPWPEDFAETRDRIERLMKPDAPAAAKAESRKIKPKTE